MWLVENNCKPEPEVVVKDADANKHTACAGHPRWQGAAALQLPRCDHCVKNI